MHTCKNMFVINWNFYYTSHSVGYVCVCGGGGGGGAIMEGEGVEEIKNTEEVPHGGNDVG